MNNTPKLNFVLFGLYLLLTVGVLIAAFVSPAVRSMAYAPLRALLLPDNLLGTDSVITVRVAVPDELEDWLRQAAADFGRQNAHIAVEVVVVQGGEAYRELDISNPNLADVWIAEADFVQEMVGSVPFTSEGPSVAHNRLTWVAVNARTDLAQNMDWASVAQVAQQDLQFKIGLPPVNSVEAMIACASAAADYHQTEALTPALVRDQGFQQWLAALADAAPNRSRYPVEQLSSRPAQVDVGLLLMSGMQQLPSNGFFSQEPQYNFALNYPYFLRERWPKLSASDARNRQSAAEKFQTYLLSDAAQGQLSLYGLERAETPGGLVLDAATVRALRTCWP